MIIEVGSRVRATVQAVENDAEPDPTAAECESGWVHAEVGEEGTVEFIARVAPVGSDEEDEVGITVRFDRTGTATMLFAAEIEPV